MDVAEKDVQDIPGIDADFSQLISDRFECRFRAGIEKDRAVIGFEQCRGDDAGSSEMLSIENVDHAL
jgi:hypothetical protein